MSDLRVDVSGKRASTVVALTGDVDLSTAGYLRERLNAIAASGVTDVVVDLRDASFLDGTGLGILLGGIQRLSSGGHVTLRSPPPEVRELIDLTTPELQATISIEPSPPATA